MSSVTSQMSCKSGRSRKSAYNSHYQSRIGAQSHISTSHSQIPGSVKFIALAGFGKNQDGQVRKRTNFEAIHENLMDKNLNSQYAYNDEEEDYYDEKINETAPSVRSRNDKPNTALGTQNMFTALI